MNAKSTVEILAISSSGDSYTVALHLEESGISASCSCPAGTYRTLCKHIMQVLRGDPSILYDASQRGLLDQIVAHLQTTVIPSLLAEFDESERVLKQAQRNVRKTKKNIEKVILQK